MYPGLKITHDDVIIMRSLNRHNCRVYTSGKLCRMFGLSIWHTSKILRGVAYKYIPFPIQPYASEIAKKFINSQLYT